LPVTWPGKVLYPFKVAEVHTCINIERMNIERRNNEEIKALICITQSYPSDSQNTPQRRLEITVRSVRRPRAVDIAFEVLTCVNSHIHIGHGKSVSRGHQVFNLKWDGDQFTSQTREGRTYLATITLLPYPRIKGILAVNWRSLRRICLFQKASPDVDPLL
jgi:hypothetical protein